MKKSKKLVSMLLAAGMMLSLGSVGAFAEESVMSLDKLDNLQKAGLISTASFVEDDPYSVFPEIGSEVTLYDENGEAYTATVGGYLETIVNSSAIEPAWISNWYNKVDIPRNIDGNQGVQVGLTYTATVYDQNAAFSTRNWNAYLNRLNFSVTETVGGYSTVYFGYVQSPGDVLVPGFNCVQGRTYRYHFSSEQNTNSKAQCDIQLFSIG